ncbi:hypothetical protein RAB80_006151 [Fusarium oxysporum f. sp. vasinfectum]|nr:hypothetical protein RAB80_006151 [Fusarium oxysporum f. sp. vasinfectum]
MTAESTIPSQAAVVSQNGHPRTKICVYCGAAPGASPAHIEAARALGRAMAENNIDLGAIKALREYKVSDAIYQLQWGSQ